MPTDGKKKLAHGSAFRQVAPGNAPSALSTGTRHRPQKRQAWVHQSTCPQTSRICNIWVRKQGCVRRNAYAPGAAHPCTANTIRSAQKVQAESGRPALREENSEGISSVGDGSRCSKRGPEIRALTFFMCA